MVGILRTTFSNAFSRMITIEFWYKFHWMLFLRAQLTTSHHSGSRINDDPFQCSVVSIVSLLSLCCVFMVLFRYLKMYHKIDEVERSAVPQNLKLLFDLSSEICSVKLLAFASSEYHFMNADHLLVPPKWASVWLQCTRLTIGLIGLVSINCIQFSFLIITPKHC